MSRAQPQGHSEVGRVVSHLSRFNLLQMIFKLPVQLSVMCSHGKVALAVSHKAKKTLKDYVVVFLHIL